jgi:hypothetical protein
MMTFVALLVEREGEVEQRVLRADRDRDLARLRGPSAHGGGAPADGLLQSGDAGDRGVLRDAGLEGLPCRLDDERRRLEVGLTDAEREDVDALVAQLGCARIHRERDARLYDFETAGKGGRHGRQPYYGVTHAATSSMKTR